MSAEASHILHDTNVVSPWTKRLYGDSDFWTCSDGLFHAYAVHRTLRGDYQHVFHPDRVMYVGKYPAAYLKTLASDAFPDPDVVRKWQQFLWNQAVVPVLIIQTRTKMRVYAANVQPRSSASDSTEGALCHVLETTADAIELDKIKTDIETGKLYEDHPAHFDRSLSVDQYLLHNLNAAAKTLTAAIQEGCMADDPKTDEIERLKFCHRYLTRVLFTCYLIERKMVKGKYFSQQSILSRLRPSHEATARSCSLRDVLAIAETDCDKAKRELSRLSKWIKSHFNGSMFPDGHYDDSDLVDDTFLLILLGFLDGHDIGSGQYYLGFWAYDFSVIPIETISAVYEGFLKAEGEVQQDVEDADTQRSSGAYYTPPHLAELTVDIALEGCTKPIHELTVLDPACGSGVFLVALFGRMADSLRRTARFRSYRGKKPSVRWAREILKLLDRLYGLDISGTACHITCFSLYLAALEQMTPMDVEALRDAGEKLPDLLLAPDDGFDDGVSIVKGNVFQTDLPLQKQYFDLLVGNPPWVSRDKQKDEAFLAWRKAGGVADEKVRAPGKQIAHGFMWKACEFLRDTGRACLLLPSAVLLNSQTNAFQAKWVKAITVERVVNFSDLSFLLFKGADRPCVAVRFSAQPLQDEDHIIRYESPKTDIRSQHGGPIHIREEDMDTVAASDVLRDAQDGKAHEVWKSRFWGTWRDQRLLSRLMSYSRLSELVEDTRAYTHRVGSGDPARRFFLKGQGVIRGKRNPQDGWWDAQTPYFRGANLRLVLLPSECVTVEEAEFPLKAQWPRIRQLFQGPKVLVSQGARDMKVAFCDFTVLFQDALQAIAGEPKDGDLLRFLSIAIKSDVAQYYLFHTSANWGTERDKVHFGELLSLPFLLPEDAADSRRAQEIVSQVAEAVRGVEDQADERECLGREERADSLRRELEPLIREYYGIDDFESMLINDTVGEIIPSSTPDEGSLDIRTLRRVGRQDCRIYADTLCDAIAMFCGKNTLCRDRKTPYAVRVYYGHPYAIVRLDPVARARKTTTSDSTDELRNVLHRLQPLLDRQEGGIIFCRNLKVFIDGSLYIIKPTQYRFWMRTAALNDADEIAGAVIATKEGL